MSSEQLRAHCSCIGTMAIELVPLPLPDSADASKLSNFGREVKGVNPANITPGSDLFREIESALYTVCI